MATAAPTTTKAQTDKPLDSVPVADTTEGGGLPPPTNSAQGASSEAKEITEDPVGDNVDSGSKNANGNGKGNEKDGAPPVTDTEKKIRRAERFGMPVQLSEEEKRNSRAERFGTAPSSQGSDSTKKADELKRKARAERFGIPHPMSTDEDEKKKARLARFASASSADPLEEQKKKARALRFSETQASSNGKIQPNPAIAGEAGGEA